MADPFLIGLRALYASPIGTDAIYTPAGGAPLDPIRVIHSQPSDEMALGDRYIEVATNFISFLRESVPLPAAGDALVIAAGAFIVRGMPKLDTEGLSWSCEVEPA